MREEGGRSTTSGRSWPHVWAAVAAVLTLVMGCAGVEGFVRWRLAGSLESFAGIMPPVKLTGNVLATGAIGRKDFLVVYGSSELDHDAENRPDVFFARRPTGFVAFPIGRAGCACLINAGKLAALGEALRGRKVVILLSPSWFLHDADPEAVAANLRPLQAGSWVFGGGLSVPLKRELARRLQAYPEALEAEPLLGRAVADLAEGSWWSGVEWRVVRPLGWGECLLLREAEFWEILRDLPGMVVSHRQRQKEKQRVELEPPRGLPDWEQLAAAGEAYERALGDASPYSVGLPERVEKGAGQKGEGSDGGKAGGAPRERDTEFLTRLAASKEWTDLGLLLRVLREAGAEALVVSQPFNGRYREAGGETPGIRRAYYGRLDQVVQAAGFAVRDFAEREEDRTFFNDAGHPSAKAWIFYDRVMDDFYHGRVGEASRRTGTETSSKGSR